MIINNIYITLDINIYFKMNTLLIYIYYYYNFIFLQNVVVMVNYYYLFRLQISKTPLNTFF